MSLVDRIVGVDLGSRQDWTAVVVVDLSQAEATEDDRFPPSDLRVVYTKRLRRLPWPAIADELGAMGQWPALYGCRWVVDQSGVGRPVVDLLRGRVPVMVGVTITSGNDVSRLGPREVGVPKVDLVSAVQVLLQTGRLTVDPATKDAGALRDELLAFTYTITESGHIAMGAGSGHDDLVLALALACWQAVRSEHNGATAWGQYLRSLVTPRRLPDPRSGRGRVLPAGIH